MDPRQVAVELVGDIDWQTEVILHQGCKMILGGTSKSSKSWCLLDLGVSVASGQK
jgi:RecA-family ATPase